MQQLSQQRIRFLENKVKQLEKQIAQRVRSYLIHTNKKGIMSVKNVSRHIQTEDMMCSKKQSEQASVQTEKREEHIVQGYNLLKESGISMYQATSDNQSSQQFRDDCSPIKINQISNFSTQCSEETLLANKRQVGAILLKLIENQQKSQNSESLTLEPQTTENKEQNMSEFYKKERKKLRKEISRLKQKLQFQMDVSNQAKQGLLKSEQQNYAFRLKLSEISKEFKRQLQEKSQLQQRNKQLLQQSQGLKHNLQQISQTFNLVSQPQLPEQLQIKYDRMFDFSQLLKDRLHNIASLLPAKPQKHQSMFRPEDQDQMLQVVLQIEAYFAEAEKAYEQIIQQANNSKSIFISTMQVLHQLIDHEVRKAIIQKLEKLPDLRYCLNIFRKKQTDHANN